MAERQLIAERERAAAATAAAGIERGRALGAAAVERERAVAHERERAAFMMAAVTAGVTACWNSAKTAPRATRRTGLRTAKGWNSRGLLLM